MAIEASKRQISFKATRAIQVEVIALGAQGRQTDVGDVDGVFTRERAYNFSRILLDYAGHKEGCPLKEVSLETVVSDHWPICNCGLSVMKQQLKVWGHYVN